ncbi:unnamed protein product [Caenorhabditis auriculariae]|uniref:DUF4440 domain-containing protein n=1 Tax=Caenorhabditis auriculariae TaxID=2777116 RepID=A0A8S1HCQ2_9PELO|nr:unnamed protein product [Caenorhabditis auriculariae]
MAVVSEAIKTLFEQYCEAVYSRNYEEVIKFYDDDAVLIEKGQACHYGPKDIVDAIKAYHTKLGHRSTENYDEEFFHLGDYYIYDCKYHFKLKSEVRKERISGSYNQIWRKVGDDYKIIRDVFSIESRSSS